MCKLLQICLATRCVYVSACAAVKSTLSLSSIIPFSLFRTTCNTTVHLNDWVGSLLLSNYRGSSDNDDVCVCLVSLPTYPIVASCVYTMCVGATHATRYIG